MQSLETTSGDSEMTSLWHFKTSWRVTRGYGICWKLRQVAFKARNITENALPILVAIFPHNSNKPRSQTESCVFSYVVLV